MKKTRLYRFFEILPGALTWFTLAGSVIFSWLLPVWVAIYILLFDLYWVLKAVNTSMHLLSGFGKLKLHATYDWRSRLDLLRDPQEYKKWLRQEIVSSPGRRKRLDLKGELIRLDSIDFRDRPNDWREIYHLVILPTYKETLQVLRHSVSSVADSGYPKDRIIFVLATEERDRENAGRNAEALERAYGGEFLRFLHIMHPDGIPGELAAKGANMTYAARKILPMLSEMGIAEDHVLVSAFDSDTVVSKNYFDYLTYAFLTAEKPYRSSYQPMPVYNNNIWDAPAISRVVAVADSFWQMVDASRPDRLITFSSHAMTLRALIEADFWPVDAISDDSQIFFRCWLHYNGDYRTIPLFTNVSLDAMLDETYWRTLIGQYKQKRRWTWGVENFPYLVTGCIGRPIPFWKKALYIQRMLESFYFRATASITIAILGWLPLLLGGEHFGGQVLAFNLPLLTRVIMQVATAFLVFSVYINMIIIPRRPPKYSRWRTASMIAQWVFVPIVSTVFGSVPAIDSQTRLMFGRYMGFWVTPKARKSLIRNPAAVFSSPNHDSRNA